jgi:hypothetical protein
MATVAGVSTITVGADELHAARSAAVLSGDQ